MKKSLENAAFIDGNNFYKFKNDLGWKIDTLKFRKYLTEKYAVGDAYYCVGYIESNKGLYQRLESEGYEMVFKETYVFKGEIKGNIDSELVLKCMNQYRVYKKAIIVTSDGDFACLVQYLIDKDKLLNVISKRIKCSHLLEKASRTFMCYMDDLRNEVEYK